MPVVLVDEFMTSQISSATLEKLEDVYCWKPVKSESGANTGDYKLEKCWSLKQYHRRCANGTGRTFRGLVERNRNAAANIRDLLRYWLVHHDRPPQFKRSSNKEENRQAATANPTRRIVGKKPQVPANNTTPHTIYDQGIVLIWSKGLMLQ